MHDSGGEGSGCSMGVEGVRRGVRTVCRDDRHHVAAGGQRHQDRTRESKPGTGWVRIRRRCVALAAVTLAAAALLAEIVPVDAQAQRLLTLSSSRRSVSV